MVTLSVTDDLGGTAEKQSTIRVISGTPLEKQWNILWSKDFATGGSLATVSAAVGDDARIYALSTLGQLYAYDRDGNQLWSFDLTQNGTVLSTERLNPLGRYRRYGVCARRKRSQRIERLPLCH